MKTKNKQSRKLQLILVASLVIPFFLPSYASSEETYVFERMWPTLQQPWYFNIVGVAIDNSGNVYVADNYNNRIQKFTLDGTFVTKWGSEGAGNGQFKYPEGIAVDRNGNVYVADTLNDRIQKFTSDGTFIAKWGSAGTGNGEFDNPRGIAVDPSGNVYVADAKNHRIQKFTSDGTFIAKWGSAGSGDGQFYSPRGIVIDGSGNVYVADYYNHRIQKFTTDGTFVTKWGSYGYGDGQFYGPEGIAVDGSRNVYVADTDNNQIQKFTTDGTFVTKWGSEGAGNGQFKYPEGIAVDRNGNVYVADTYNHRIQKFAADGTFIDKWGSAGTGNGEFDIPCGIAVDPSGNVYVADAKNHRIQKFTSDGTFVTKWGSEGTGDGEFDFYWPYIHGGIAVDPSGYIYVADTDNHRIQKFTSDGTFVTKWGSYGYGDGQFYSPTGIATYAIDGYVTVYVADTSNHRIQGFTSDGTYFGELGSEGTGNGQFKYPEGIAFDRNGNVYVADTYNHRIQKFAADGTFITKWGSEGSGDGQFYRPRGIAVDGSGNVYVADWSNHRIQKFAADGQFITKFGEFGSDAGQLSQPRGVCVSTDGRIYVADTNNDRIQVFSPAPGETVDKAIIVAGGGAFAGNNIWDATQMCANYAYRALTYQGYTKDTIYYLTSDTDLDLDGNGVLDDVDADATNTNLQYAITTWAQDAEDLFIYMVNHGGGGTFRMGATELLYASDLDTWLDTIQEVIPGKLTFVYDACRSGSFVPVLDPPAGKERILATSASASEEAIFGSQGTISFSFLFWARMFNGDSFYDCFYHATNSLGVTYPQTPLLEGNGNGIGNESGDKEAAQALRIGNETRFAGDIPVIGSVLPAQTLDGETSCLIYADDVIDADGISRVWAVITPPGYSAGSPDNPVTDLPIVDLTSVGSSRYQGTYSNFNITGTYNIAIYATDGGGVISLPKSTTVTVTEGSGIENGYLVTSDLWIRAVINTVEKGPIEAVWKKGGEDTTSRGDRVIWGHFYAGPADVTWGSANNPDLFVKIWFDHYGRLDVNFFHVSVPDVEVYSDYPYDGTPDEQGTTTMSRRYIRQYYESGQSYSEESHEDGAPPAGYSPAGNPSGYSTVNDLKIGSAINTVEKGPIDALWRLGGQDTTSRGDQVVWGHFYASPSDVTWGSQDNPDLFVKIWFDYTGRVDVNFFHVSVPDIEVYSDFPSDAAYDQQGTTILDDRYIRHEYQR